MELLAEHLRHLALREAGPLDLANCARANRHAFRAKHSGPYTAPRDFRTTHLR